MYKTYHKSIKTLINYIILIKSATIVPLRIEKLLVLQYNTLVMNESRLIIEILPIIRLDMRQVKFSNPSFFIEKKNNIK